MSSATLWLTLFILLWRTERSSLRQVLRTNKCNAILAGVGIHGTYALVLISMAFVKNVSYVVAFRQLSIPIGVTLGILILREPLYKPKLVGVSIMFIGLMLVAIK